MASSSSSSDASSPSKFSVKHALRQLSTSALRRYASSASPPPSSSPTSAACPSTPSLLSITSAVFTHHIAPFLSYRVLLTLRAVSTRLSVLSSHRSSWGATVFTPRSLHHLLYLASSTSSSFPSLYFACLDLRHCGLLSDQHLDLVLRCFPHLTAIELSDLHRLSLHSLTLLSLHLSASPSGTSQLQRLTFHGAAFPFSMDEVVPHHPLLAHIDLSASLRLASRSLSVLSASFLTSLVLARCTQISDASFAFLLPSAASAAYVGQAKQSMPLHALTLLDVSGCHRLTNRACLAFSQLPSLESLSLSRCPRMSSFGLHHLSSQSSVCRSSLASLSLCALVKLSDACVPFLTRLPSLTALDFSDTSLSSSAIVHLMQEKAASLQRLVVDGCDKISTEGLAALLTPHIVDARASFNYHLTSEAMEAVVRGKDKAALQTLALRYTSLTDPLFLAQPFYSTLTSLDLSGNGLVIPPLLAGAGASALPRLQSLSLSSCILFPALLTFFAHAAPQLHHLDLSFCQSLTNSLLSSFPSLFPGLSSLVLDNTLINDQALLILSAFPRLSSLSLHECRLITAQGMRIFHDSSSSSQSLLPFHSFFSSLFSSSAGQASAHSAASTSSSSAASSTSSSPGHGHFASLSSLSNFSLPSLPASLSFDFPSSFSLPASISSHLPHVQLPSMPTVSMPSLPTHLSLPRPSLTFHSLQSHLRSSNLSFPSSLSSFSSPFSSAFSSLQNEPTSPFAPSVEEEEHEEDAVSTSSSTRAQAGMEVDAETVRGEEDNEEAEAQEEPDTIAPPSPPLASLSSTSSLSHTDDEDDEGDDAAPASPLSLSTSSLSSSASSSAVPGAAASPSPPLVPFASLTFLHVCCISGAVGKEEKLVALIKRSHPHCTVEGESERQNKEDKEKEERDRRERRQREGLLDNDDRLEEDDDADALQEDDEEERTDADPLTWDGSDDDDELAVEEKAPVQQPRPDEAGGNASLDDVDAVHAASMDEMAFEDEEDHDDELDERHSALLLHTAR